jgi:hypothetical protein
MPYWPTMPPLYKTVQRPWATVVLVPTGVGATIGGYAGDATQALHTIAQVSPVCITHPNVLNAAVFFNKPSNAFYVEGHALDAFLQGELALTPVTHQAIGVIWDAGIDPAVKVVQANALNATQTIYGVHVVAQTTTTQPLDLWCGVTQGSISQGGVRNPQVLLHAAQQLIGQGATAIALCVQFPDSAEGEADYMAGQGVDPVGGLEAILSHWVVQHTGLPCAHAPAFSWTASQPETTHVVDARVAAEVIAPTFLPCILQGLHQAPTLTPVAQATPTCWQMADVKAVIVPANTLGSPGVLACLQAGQAPVVAVAENTTVCHTPHIRPTLTVATYADAADWLAQL